MVQGFILRWFRALVHAARLSSGVRHCTSVHSVHADQTVLQALKGRVQAPKADPAHEILASPQVLPLLHADQTVLQTPEGGMQASIADLVALILPVFLSQPVLLLIYFPAGISC